MKRSKAPPIGFSLHALGDVHGRDLTIRFAFGATMSTVAAVTATVAGPRFGGIFLAFPAILPATLTLIERQEREQKAKDVDVGAILGAAALIPFAWLSWLLIPRIGSILALLAAIGGWLVSAVTLYLAVGLAVEHGPS